jgi:carbohydrate-selective porin OprB
MKAQAVPLLFSPPVIPPFAPRSLLMRLALHPFSARRSFTRVAAVLVLALLVTSQPSRAADEATAEDAKPAPKQTAAEQFKEVWNRDLFTGDWEGWRTTLHDHGIDAQFRLSQYGQGVASDGVDKNGEYGGTMDYRVNTDLRKLFGLWEGVG